MVSLGTDVPSGLDTGHSNTMDTQPSSSHGSGGGDVTGIKVKISIDALCFSHGYYCNANVSLVFAQQKPKKRWFDGLISSCSQSHFPATMRACRCRPSFGPANNPPASLCCALL